jgi:hypothetical protein
VDAPPIPAGGVNWNDLTQEEQTALNRMNRGRDAALPEAVGLRLINLGLAILRPDGIGISRYGRELVINRLLESRYRD